MNKLSFTKVLLTTSLFLLGTATMASANGVSNCQVIYGGGTVCSQQVSFTIDKKVQKPTKGGEWVDNLSVNDAMFSPRQAVPFQVTVQNTGSQDITLNVKDVLPSYLGYISGGSYDANSKTVTNIVTLKAGASQTFTIIAVVTDASSLPANQSTVCVTNVARATENSGAVAEDNAQFCIQKGATIQAVVPTKAIPNTGPEALALLFLPPLGAAGLYLRKKTGL